MFEKSLRKLFKTKSERDFRRMEPVMREVNRHAESYRQLSDEALRGKTAEFRTRLADGASLYAVFDPAATGSGRSPLEQEFLPLEKRYRTGDNRIFYLALPPSGSEGIIHHLGQAGFSREGRGYTRIVIEKPFGRNLDSARELNALLRSYFQESQIYRIDHYLAKEPVQNILMFRFAISIFEPLWNSRYIDHIQITSAETLGIEHATTSYNNPRAMPTPSASCGPSRRRLSGRTN